MTKTELIDWARQVKIRRQLSVRDISERYKIVRWRIEWLFRGKFSDDKKQFFYNLFKKIEKEIPEKPIICDVCGKVFFPDKEIPAKTIKRCSKECAAVGKKRNNTIYMQLYKYKKDCPVCGKKFETSSPTRRYCSRECRLVGWGQYIHRCRNCKKEIQPGYFYCSDACREEHQYKMDRKRFDMEQGIRQANTWDADMDHINDILSNLEGGLY